MQTQNDTPRRPGKRKKARRSTIYPRFFFLSPFPPFRPVPADIGQALKARDRRATPAATAVPARRFNQRTKVPRLGAAASPARFSPGAPFTALGLSGVVTRSVYQVTCGRAWHLF